MLLSTKQILFGAFALFSGLATADDCEVGPWTDVRRTGG